VKRVLKYLSTSFLKLLMTSITSIKFLSATIQHVPI
jgi:hypothetical protein